MPSENKVEEAKHSLNRGKSTVGRQDTQQEDEYGLDNDHQTIDNSSKPFLKRKSQAVKFQKLKWKGQSRIDCWKKEGKIPSY